MMIRNQGHRSGTNLDDEGGQVLQWDGEPTGLIRSHGRCGCYVSSRASVRPHLPSNAIGFTVSDDSSRDKYCTVPSGEPQFYLFIFRMQCVDGLLSPARLSDPRRFSCPPPSTPSQLTSVGRDVRGHSLHISTCIPGSTNRVQREYASESLVPLRLR